MNGFSILMFIFGICIFLVGIYIYTGNKIKLLSYKAPYKNLTKKEWKNIGKWAMIISIIPLILSLLGIITILIS